MAERRINIDSSLVDFVKELTDSESDRRIFDTMAHCLTFAAAYGFKKNRREKVNKAPNNKVDPIAFHIFENHRFDSIFTMLAMASVDDPKTVLGSDGGKPDIRVGIFEEYAKGGLSQLRDEIKGMVDYLDPITQILLIDEDIKKGSGGFELSDLEV